ncbi:MAG: hypothetical protein ACREAA_17510 [Candidatus Polarisedimenticolia bacterium]
MPVQDDVYTISEQDVLRSLEGSRRKRVSPDWRPSTSVRGPAAGQARPLVASTLSLLISGSGQAYNGQGQLGLLFFVMQAFAGAAHWAVIQRWSDVVEMGVLFGWSEWQLFRAGVAIDAVFLLLLLANVYQAYRRAEKDAGGFDGLGNPAVSGLASMLIPGWGQLANAQAGKAMVFLFGILAGAATVAILALSPFLRLLSEVDPNGAMTLTATRASIAIMGTAAVLWVLSVYDAVLVASHQRRMN